MWIPRNDEPFPLKESNYILEILGISTAEGTVVEVPSVEVELWELLLDSHNS